MGEITIVKRLLATVLACLPVCAFSQEAMESTKTYNSVSVGDVGEICANILLNAEDSTHHGKTYNLVG